MKRKPPAAKCYPSDSSGIISYIGYALIALGAIMLFLCIPGWAWLAIIGLGLLAAGFLVLSISSGGR